MCPLELEGECGHTNQIMTTHVTCVTWSVTINHVSEINCNFVLSYFQLFAVAKNVYHNCRTFYFCLQKRD